ncbi:MAG: family 1 encapsulin nanocompartment shell protein [Streptosporangiales bacterium]
MSAGDHLLRGLAPIPTVAWQAIDDEARERLTPLLAARKLADWKGPSGWQQSSVSLGRTTALDGPPGISTDGVTAKQRRVLPLAEYTVPFTVSRQEIDELQRGASDPDFDDLARAAGKVAEVENRTVFHGWAAAGITGIAQASPYGSGTLGDDCDAYPGVVARAVDQLRCNGIVGPYALAIGPAGYTRIIQTAEHGGHLLFDHLKQVVGGSILWAPGVDGAVVVSERGGDFLLDVGQDISVGYSHHDSDAVQLYFEESFTFRVLEPDAALALN